jgi:hypothetical protein
VLSAQPDARGRPVEIGWCERISLPELGAIGLRAKIDTGARSSALHVVSIGQAGTTASGRPLFEIELPSGRGSTTTRARVEIREHATVRDSGGHAERRPVIETLLRLGSSERRIRVTLTSRGDMRFPMLIGRTALGPEVRIDPTRRFLL